MPDKQLSITIVIPAYNEEHRIGPMLRQYILYFGIHVHFITVTNGCTDNTENVVQSLQNDFPRRITLHSLGTTQGKGTAIIEGWKRATGELVGFVDADGATPPEEFEKLFHAIQGKDGAIASRFVAGSVIHHRQSFLRNIMSVTFISLVRLLFRIPFHDMQCGAKLFTNNAIEQVLPSLHEPGMIFDVELLWKLHKQHRAIVEVPTVWSDQPGSASLGNLRQFITQATYMFIGILRLRFLAKK